MRSPAPFAAQPSFASGSVSRAILDAADGRSLTYRQLNHWRNRIANGLIKSGVEKGERVGLLMPNCLEFIPAQHGIWAAGASLVQMATRSATEGARAGALS